MGQGLNARDPRARQLLPRTRECYVEPSPPRRTGRDDTRAYQPSNPPARMTPEKIIHQDIRPRVPQGSAHGVPASGHTTRVHVISQGRGLRDVENQGTGSQNTCGSDDDREPREPPPSQATLASGNRTEAPTHTPPEPRGTARHGTQRARHPADRAKATGRPAQAPTPHHRACTTPRGSHGEHGGAPKRTEGALPPTGVYIRSAQAKQKEQLQGTAMHKMMGCACNAASRVRQGMWHRISNLFSAFVPIISTFSPRGRAPP